MPSSIARIRTLIPAMCESGKRSDHVFPGCALSALLDARAEEISADVERPTSFGAPELPVVAMTRLMGRATALRDDWPNTRAGPSEFKAAKTRAIDSLAVHSGSAERSSRCAFCSIARVGYRS